MQNHFPVKNDPYKGRTGSEVLPEDIIEVSDDFSFNFHTAGLMRNGNIFTAHVDPVLEESIPLQDILLDENLIDEKFYLSPEVEEKFAYLRGSKKIERTTADGHKYYFLRRRNVPY